MPLKKPIWTTDNLDTKSILLDINNPRIEVDDTASQEEIRMKLLEFEDVLDLARSISKNEGLFYGERIISVIENGEHVVLEGNRRVAACQMLINPNLVPKAYKTRFPLATANTLTNLKRLSSDIAPNRESAEPILTKRHTEQGVKPWSPVAKMRRAVRLLDRMSVPEVAELLGTTASQVNKLIRPYRLLKYAIDLKGWSENERKALEDEKLKTNPYTRLFTLKRTKEILQLQFDDNENVISALPSKVFKDQMKRIVRDFLIPDPAEGKPRYDTRTDPDDYFSAFIKSPAGKASDSSFHTSPTGVGAQDSISATKGRSSDAASTTVGSARPKTPKASVFFENLECHVQDDNLIKLTNEIKKIDPLRMPIAASLMTRAIFECALVYQLKKTKTWGELIKSDGKDPRLSEIIKFCKNFNNGVFKEQNICKTLASHTTDNAKNYLDAMTHLKYQGVDAPTLVSFANNLRPVIQYILSGQ